MTRFTVILLFLFLKTTFLVAQTSIITFNSSWKYLDNGSDQGTAWRAASFDDLTWKTGNGKFGYGIPDAATVVSYGTSSSSKYLTTYFRKTITIDDVAAYSDFSAKVNRDDGVVVYVNGVEVFRNNMPTGTITYTTRASSTSGGDDGATPIAFSVPVSAFVSGTNTLAVEIHQATPSSSDIAFDFELTGKATTTENPPINQPPTVSISSPLENASYTLGDTIQITAEAADPENALTKVEFFANAAKVGEAHTSPYLATLVATTAGTYNLSAIATDSAGAIATSASITIQVVEPTPVDQTAPAVTSITRLAPTDPTTKATTVTYRVTFSEPVSGVDPNDFLPVAVSGTVAGSLAADAVVAINSSTYDATISGITGTGTLRLDLSELNTGIADTAHNALAAGYTTGEMYTIEPDTTGDLTTTGFRSITKLTPVPISTTTGEKPQSKVWKHAGKHWAVIPNSTGTHLWRLDGTTWTNILRLSTRTTSKADCKMVGDLAHILLFQGRSSQMISIEYSTASGTYQLWSKRTSTVGLSFESGVETATIDIDGTGRMWLVSDASSTILARWSDSPYNTWSAPITVASGLTSDDIGAVIAMPGKIGVFWSNQNTERFGFRTHVDGAAPSSWSSEELAAAQSAYNVGSGMADDHLNLAVGSDGTLYCGVKTGYDANGYPEVLLLVRRTSGNWDNAYSVAPLGTRPVVLLNESAGKVRVIYTANDTGGNILYRESALAPIAFGSAMTLMSGGSYNNATSTKDNFTTDVVILASTSSEAGGVLASDGSTPPTDQTAPTVAGISRQVPTTASTTATSVKYRVTFSEPVTGVDRNDFLPVAVSGTVAGSLASDAVVAINSSTYDATVSGITGTGTLRLDLKGSGTGIADAAGNAIAAGYTSGQTYTIEQVETPIQYTLAVTTTGSGTVSKSPDQASYASGSTVTLTATPATGYQFSGWSGDAAGTTNPLTLTMNANKAIAANFTPVSSTQQQVVSFTLVNASLDQDIGTIAPGEVISLASLPTTKLTIRANTSPATVGSVRLELTGPVNRNYTDNLAPYSLFGDDGKGNYYFGSWGPPPAGTYTLKATPYTGASGSGTAGMPLTISFTFTEQAALMASSSTKEAQHPQEPEGALLAAKPNPFTNKASITFTLPAAGEYSLLLYDHKGAQVRALETGISNTGETRTVVIDSSGLAAGMYVVRLQTTTGSRSLKLLLQK